jgi:hypothetical protein
VDVPYKQVYVPEEVNAAAPLNVKDILLPDVKPPLMTEWYPVYNVPLVV